MALEVKRGVDKWWRWTFRVPDTGAPRNLTGSEVTGIVRSGYNDNADILYEWSPADNNVAVTSDGKAIVQVPSEDSALFTWREGYAEIRLTHPSGEVEQMYEGRIKISPSVFP